MNQFEKAQKLYEDLHVRHPNVQIIFNQYCSLLLLRNDKSLLSLLESMIKDSDDLFLKYLLGCIEGKKGNYNHQYIYYRDSTKLMGIYPDFWFNIGILYFNNDQSQDAVLAFQRAIYLKNDFFEAWMNLGLIFELVDEPKVLDIYFALANECKNNYFVFERIRSYFMEEKPLKSMICDYVTLKYVLQYPELIADQFISNLPEIKIKSLFK